MTSLKVSDIQTKNSGTDKQQKSTKQQKSSKQQKSTPS